MSADALGLLEIRSWSAAMAALDAAEKAGDIALVQVELNDFYGAVLKLTGSRRPCVSLISAATATSTRSSSGEAKMKRTGATWWYTPHRFTSRKRSTRRP